jgi:DNA-binding transcriptional ArsR family regulator
MDDTTPEHGWRISRSIGLELDVASYFVRMGADALPKTLADLAMSMPKTWFEEFDAMNPVSGSGSAAEGGLRATVEPLARWAGVLEEEDYDKASAAMRELTAADAISQIVSSSGLEPASGLDDAEALVELELRLNDELWGMCGVHRPLSGEAAEREATALAAAVGGLRGQPLHGRFWHWTDRFYYEAYRSWRESRSKAMDEAESDAIEHLGTREGVGAPPLDWVSSSNTLRANETVLESVEAGEIDVVFWSEPFGLSNTWALAPGMVLSSFAQRGPLYEQYVTMREDLVKRLKALADPTRVSILRMIRAHDLDNTQLAKHLEVSRPTVSVHAKVLADAGFISTELDGRKAEHSYEPDAVQAMCDDLIRFLDIPKG